MSLSSHAPSDGPAKSGVSNASSAKSAGSGRAKTKGDGSQASKDGGASKIGTPPQSEIPEKENTTSSVDSDIAKSKGSGNKPINIKS